MSKKTRIILLILCALAFCAAVTVAAVKYIDYRNGGNIYASTSQFIVTPTPAATQTPALPTPGETARPSPTPEPLYYPQREIDFDALRAINPDVMGWIYIEGTKVDLPLLHGEDNVKYVEYTYDNQKNDHGALFIDWRNNGRLTNKNTIIYGHNMADDTMFGDLDQYYKQSFYDDPAHQYVYVYTPEKVFVYKIYTVYRTDARSETYTRSFTEAYTFADFIAYTISSNALATNETADAGDRVLTLSTCSMLSYYDRIVVQAKLLNP